MNHQFAQVCPTGVGVVSASSRGTAVTAGTSAGSFSASFYELTASVEYDSQGFWLHSVGSGSNQQQLKLYVGAAASETEFLHTFISVGGYDTVTMFVPILLPAGVRVTAKTACNYQELSYIHLNLVRGTAPVPLASRGTLIGYSGSAGTNVDCGATANTKGSWAQLSASTSRDAKGFTLHIADDASCDTNNTTVMDIGVGASSSEVIVFGDAVHYQESYRSRSTVAGPVWTPIPAASRVAARAQSSSNGANSRVPVAAITLWE